MLNVSPRAIIWYSRCEQVCSILAEPIVETFKTFYTRWYRTIKNNSNCIISVAETTTVRSTTQRAPPWPHVSRRHTLVCRCGPCCNTPGYSFDSN